MSAGKKIKTLLPSQLTPKSCGYGTGWVREMDQTWTNGNHVVLARDIQTAWGRVTHAFIRDAKNKDIPWNVKQQIKNMLFGDGATAIEVFPSEIALVDEVGAYHLWVLHDIALPFCLKFGGGTPCK